MFRISVSEVCTLSLRRSTILHSICLSISGPIVDRFDNHVPLKLHYFISDGLLRVCGNLGSLSISDLSPYGIYYRERFIFTGDKALDFDIKKYDDYDELLKREFDISVRLRMSSIRYVHTQRFQNETVAYCQHFQQLQEV